MTNKTTAAAHRPFKDGAPKEYRSGPQVFTPTLRDRTYHALRQVIENKQETLRSIATNTGLEWGWLRTFSLDNPPDPGVNKIETLYHYLTGQTL